MKAYHQEALLVFAHLVGRYWKNALSGCWMTGDYRGVPSEYVGALQELRNIASFGPAGLVKYRLPKSVQS